VTKREREQDLPQFPPEVVHLFSVGCAIKKGPTILVNGVSEGQKCKLKCKKKINN